MTYSIVFSSMTGNTAALADRLHSLLPAESCLYFGETSREAVSINADITFVGFWTDKDSCDSLTRVFLKKLSNRTVVLFGTAGYSSDPEYFRQVLNAAARQANVSNTVLPGFMCQGKMRPEVKAKCEAELSIDPENAKAKSFLERYAKAESHPDESDFLALADWVNGFMLS
ncbi:MAG: hypothetical protein HFE83_04910 [Lachnospiraceae bacterium]|jgi:flavodoxin I|nr:hypothetical protein [Lachnospiraceae bacterium]